MALLLIVSMCGDLTSPSAPVGMNYRALEEGPHGKSDSGCQHRSPLKKPCSLFDHLSARHQATGCFGFRAGPCLIRDP